MELKDNLQKRINQINSLIIQKQKSLQNPPEGYLRANKRPNGYQYYYKKNKQDHQGTYVRKDQLSQIMEIGQRIYDEKVLARANKEAALLKNLDDFYKKGSAEDVYTSLPQGYQKIIIPIQDPPEKALEKWLATEYTPKPFAESANEYYSDKKIRMRSKSEVWIANAFTRFNIPYLYEKPLILGRYGKIHPDFTLFDLNNRREVYWEHLGMLDDRESLDEYISRLNAYADNGIFLGDRLFISYETGRRPINMRVIDKKIQELARKLGYDGKNKNGL